MNSMQPSTVKSFGVLHLGNEMTHFRQATFNRPSWKYLSVLHNVTFSKRLFVFLVSMNSIHCDQLYCFDAFNMRALKTLLNWPRFALLTISHIRSTFTVKTDVCSSGGTPLPIITSYDCQHSDLSVLVFVFCGFPVRVKYYLAAFIVKGGIPQFR